ncbi:hypothetical protein GUI37_08815 [Helcococcus kunzii]|uniref:hypothetical protein n=1 Tax=Helcococcus kunzii TaxID=40091 RepID=UPI001BAE5CF7|nr:hypothetical protein [Helcococcus kunzii]QUY65620.1 hypothetical protein GUI37_08815 [Helcococcus kunzii]
MDSKYNIKKYSYILILAVLIGLGYKFIKYGESKKQEEKRAEIVENVDKIKESTKAMDGKKVEDGIKNLANSVKDKANSKDKKSLAEKYDKFTLVDENAYALAEKGGKYYIVDLSTSGDSLIEVADKAFVCPVEVKEKSLTVNGLFVHTSDDNKWYLINKDQAVIAEVVGEEVKEDSRFEIVDKTLHIKK